MKDRRGRKAKRAKASDRVGRLADELFREVEEAQGYAFISDGEGAGMTEEQFYKRIRGRLKWAEKQVVIIRGFLIRNWQP